MKGFTLPEDDPLVLTVMGCDARLARGQSGLIPAQADANYHAMEPLPKRTLAALDRAGRLGTITLVAEQLHSLIRLARAFEQETKQHRGPGPLRAEHDDPRSAMVLKATIPALLAIEATLAALDGVPAPNDLLDLIAGEIRRDGTVWPYRERHFKIITELVRRMLAIEARLDTLESGKATR